MEFAGSVGMDADWLIGVDPVPSGHMEFADSVNVDIIGVIGAVPVPTAMVEFMKVDTVEGDSVPCVGTPVSIMIKVKLH